MQIYECLQHLFIEVIFLAQIVACGEEKIYVRNSQKVINKF